MKLTPALAEFLQENKAVIATEHGLATIAEVTHDSIYVRYPDRLQSFARVTQALGSSNIIAEISYESISPISLVMQDACEKLGGNLVIHGGMYQFCWAEINSQGELTIIASEPALGEASAILNAAYEVGGDIVNEITDLVENTQSAVS